MKRRNFLGTSVAGGIGLALNSLPLFASTVNAGQKGPTFGICTDLHHDLIKDGPARVRAFIDEMNYLQPDFIIQMGDFCTPKPANQAIMDAWNGFKGPKYHVIGNHDIDGGFSHNQVLAFWNAQSAYYSFDCKGYHFIVLNGNEKAADSSYIGYPRSILESQRKWLENDLADTKLPTIVFCHQGIDNDMDGLFEGSLIRLAFERANRDAGFLKVQAVFSGHHHEDYHNVYNHINYIQINSISYQFTHPETGYTFAHTQDPLWATVTIGTKHLNIKGKSSFYSNHQPEWQNKQGYDAYPTVARISDRSISLKYEKV